MTAPLISVVVPTHNRSRRLAGALRSALGQLGDGMELVVVDDGSSDDTAGVLAGFAGSRGLRTLRNERAGGVSAARNRGAREARGEFLVFLDDDDALLDGALGHIAAVLAGDPGVDYAWGGRRVLERDGGDALVSMRDELHVPAGGRVQGVGFLPFCLRIATSCAFTVRRSRFLELGGFDESLRLSEDRDLFLRLAATPWTGFGIGRCLVEYNDHAGTSLSRGRDPRLGPLTDLRLIERHRALLESAPGQPVLTAYLAEVYAGFLRAGDADEARVIARQLARRGFPATSLARLYLRHGPAFRELKRLVRYPRLRQLLNRAGGRL